MALPGGLGPESFKLADYDFASSFGKGFKLGEMIQQKQEMDQTKQILGQSNLTTPEGMLDAAKRVSTVNPDAGMKLMGEAKQFEQVNDMREWRKAQAANQLKNEQLAEERYNAGRMDKALEITSGEGASLVSDFEERVSKYKKAGDPDPIGKAKAEIQPFWSDFVNGLTAAKDERGKPLFTPEQLKQYPTEFSPEKARSLASGAERGRKILQEERKRRETVAAEEAKEAAKKEEDALKARDLERKEKRDRDATEATQRRLDQNDRKIAQAEARAKGDFAGMDPETQTFLADAYLDGDHSVAQGLGRSGANKVAFLNAMTKRAQERGMTPEMVNVRKAEFMGSQAAQRTLGTREANLGVAAAELDRFIPIADDAMKKVPRTGFVPLNKLIQLGENQWSPQQAALVAANRAVVNAFAQVASRGVPTVHSTEEAEKMLNTAATPDQYHQTLLMLRREARQALEAPADVRKVMRDERTGGAARPAETSGGLPNVKGNLDGADPLGIR